MVDILSIFSFKKQAKQVFTKENFNSIVSLAKEAIIGQVKANIPGAEKKAAVDALVFARIDALTAGISNKLVLWLVGMVKQGIPMVTQLIYDCLKEKVENL